jgi:hypothetical protein
LTAVLPSPWDAAALALWQIGETRRQAASVVSIDNLFDRFKSKMPAWQNTFDDYPSRLNFAFEGPLRLSISAPHVGVEVFELRPVILAQGHTLAANNWWFAGGTCANIGANTLNCDIVRTSALNEHWLIDVKRGSYEHLDEHTITFFNLRLKL